MNETLRQFQDAIKSAGLNPPDEIEADGKLRRFPSNGKKSNDSGWYVLHSDGVPAGCFGDWRTGFSQTWRADIGRKLTPGEETAHRVKVEAMRQQREADEKARRQAAAVEAARIWKESPLVDHHNYLTRKGISSCGARLHHESLVLPMRDTLGTLHSLQFIYPNGDKRFLTGGQVQGCYFSIGKPDGVLCICEGFATGASIHQATGHAVAVAFNAGNLLPVSKALREKFPDLKLILCADDDYQTEANPGLTKATEAAQVVGGLLAVPDFGDPRTEGVTDFNDLHHGKGPDAIKKALGNASAPAAGNASPSAEKELGGDPVQSVDLICGSDIKPEPVEWFWDGWIAAGKVHILGGAPGTGKTTISMALAATVTTGGRWPDGSRSSIGNVVIWSGEDAPEDVLIPRLIQSGADVSRVFFVSDVQTENGERRSFDPARDIEALKYKLVQTGNVRLLIVDPIVSAVAGDSHKNAEVRRSLQPLADLAVSMKCALLGITHFSKGTGGRDPVERLTGSLAFGALARVVLVAAKHQEQGNDGRTTRVFLRAKSNIGPDDGGFEYDLHQAEMDGHPGIIASTVLWGKAVEGSAREILATAETVPEGDEVGTVDTVETWLHQLITEEGGSIDRRDVMRAAEAMGYKQRTVHRAREKLGVAVNLHGFGKEKRSLWTLLNRANTSPFVPILPSNLSGTHGTIEGNTVSEVEF
jgi:putative DNA primase/helicase